MLARPPLSHPFPNPLPPAPAAGRATHRLRHPARSLVLAVVLSGAASTADADTVVYRVNCGGPAIAALDAGPAWSQDLTGAEASPFVNAAATTDQIFGSSAPMGPPHASVPVTVPVALFADERWDPPQAPEMRWEFPVADGTYRVNLLVAEGYSGTQGVGDRLVDVVCEGVVRLAAYDIYALYGGYTPALETFVTTVADGSLSLEFRHVADDPAIRGIEIVSLQAAGVLSPSRTSVDFGDVVVNTTSAPQQVTVTNMGGPGDPAITISGASVTGPFEHTLTPQTLAPGQARAFNVTFAPGAAGPASGSLTVQHDGLSAPLVIPLTGDGVTAPTLAFGKSVLSGATLTHPTSLQFGPDGRLYVAQQDGLIRVLGVQRLGVNQYAVTSTETLASVQAIPNHDDGGASNPGVTTRLVTGLLVTGTPANPVIHVTSSDPRMNVAGDIDLDTNSGIVSRLTWDGSAWQHLDLVRGLPRSENDHATNGLALDTLTNTLYIAQGGNTNMGAPSNNFSFLPEYALAAAILSVDLDAIGETTYDLPTLDDEDRPGEIDANDPFGGNDGRNQARIVPGGPVQVHSPGWRNPYDVLLHSSGRLYAIDNGPNAGWGGPPVGEGPGAGCTNGDNDANSQSLNDNLHLVPAAGYYAGHPNPTRASTANTFNASNPQSPVPAGDPRECEYLEPGVPVASGGDGALATWGFSTNGLAEYRASNFGGALQGNLLASSYSNEIRRIALNAAGDSATSAGTLFSNVGVVPLDVTTVGDGGPLRGTVWVCDYVTGQIVVYEPADFDGTGFVCSGADSAALDEDGDGFSNADEIDNGVSPCSAADLPADLDGDYLSDLNDPDDDGDGRSDIEDAFARDALDGAGTEIPVLYSWDDGDPGTGLFGMGFTGLMADGVTDYAERFDPARITAGGAAGKFTVDEVPAGDARGPRNDARYAFHFGLATDAGTAPFRVRTRISSPFFGGAAPAGAQAQGVVLGDGGDDDYVALLVTGEAGVPVIEVVHETAGAVDSARHAVPGLLAGTAVDLVLDVDPAAATVQPRVAAGGGALQAVGSALALAPGSALHAAVTGPAPLAAGILATSRGAAPFTATWDFFDVLPVSLAGAPGGGAPARVALLAAAPNPARAGTRMRFELPAAARVRLSLFDVTGARVRTVAEGEWAAGSHTVRWDGRDDAGRPVPAGVYFQRLEVEGRSHTRRIAVVR